MNWNFDTLEIMTIECRMQACEPAVLPPFLGSTLRGAFGHAFKAVACVLEPERCRTGCGSELCAYGYGFETATPAHASTTGRHEDLPVPFVLVPPPLDGTSDRRFERGDSFTFSMKLFGRGTKLLEFVTAALADLGRNGLGANRAQFLTTDIRSSQPLTLASLIEQRRAKLGNPDQVTLQFVTPARIRLGGDLQPSIDFPLLVKNIGRRFIQLDQAHGRGDQHPAWEAVQPLATMIETTHQALGWNDWSRYSNRLQAKMKLGGFFGEITFTGPILPEFMALLLAGEILHVGTATAFGLGQYIVKTGN